MADDSRGERANRVAPARRRRRRRRAYPALALVVCAAAVAVAYAAGAFNGARAAPAGATQRKSSSGLASRLSPAQLAGQRIVYSYAGLAPPQSLLALIRAGEAAGVILF